ncbi:E3 ubiquitin-protein ligase Jade-2 [Larimichthys crocea]|uniref:Uncharacterized protein n=1 Tax=Larimichthys crocea TaxID=215358 RepID=A0ACD3R5R0_LARCR|nr:E3 ubiquitin-protein ligase Jade-2 [Larimichthys crocea]
MLAIAGGGGVGSVIIWFKRYSYISRIPLEINVIWFLITGLSLSKSFPLDNSLFDSWLAQSVQITADDMLSQWALGAQHRDKSGSLLSDQLLQGEESLLNLMMENSMQSTWKTPQLGRKPRGSNKPRARGQPQSTTPTQTPHTLLSAAAASAACSPSTAKSLWASVAEEKPSHVGRKGESHPSPKWIPVTSQRTPDRWDSIHTGNGVTSGGGSGFTASSSPPLASSPGVMVPDTGAILRGGAPRLRLSRQGKSRGRGFTGGGGIAGLGSVDLPLAGKDMSLLDTAETDGYFSDGEQSDTDTRSGGRKLRLPQLHSGNEDLLRRSVLAS